MRAPAGSARTTQQTGKLATNDLVDQVIAADSEENYVVDDAGKRLPQTSSAEVIARVLRLPDVEPHLRVLEIGTRSAFSSALMAHLVGSAGYANVTVACADGRSGFADGAPYDRVVVWATSDVFEFAWIAQTRPHGWIVAPVRVLPTTHAVVTIRVRVGHYTTLIGEKAIPGAFAPFLDRPVAPYRTAFSMDDAVVIGDGAAVSWVSGEWVRGRRLAERERVAGLLRSAESQLTLLASDEDAMSFFGFLLAMRPEGLTIDSIAGFGRAVGFGQPDTLAAVGLFSPSLFTVGSFDARATLQDGLTRWREQDGPGFDALPPALTSTSIGWSATLCQ